MRLPIRAVGKYSQLVASLGTSIQSANEGAKLAWINRCKYGIFNADPAGVAQLVRAQDS